MACIGVCASRVARIVALAAFPWLVAALPAAAQVNYKVDPQGKDELWDVTSKMEMPGMAAMQGMPGMPGMSFAMPAQSHRVCVPKGNDEAAIPRNDGCRVLDAKRAGNRVTYRMACKNANNDYTANGEMTWSGNSYQGRTQMSGKMEGETMEMAMAYTGTRAGNCTLAAR
jgi:hypothetical protein